MRRALAAAALIAGLGACAPETQANLPAAPVAAQGFVALSAKPVALNTADPAQDRIGRFVYAGGVVLTSDQTARLHGLSGMALLGTVLTAVSDEGDLISARIVQDGAGSLIGLADLKLTALTGPDGQALQGKAQSDAEGLAVLGQGDRLVSFERDHRIWLYPAAGGPPRPAPTPTTALPENDGLEALAALPALGPDAYVAGAEDGRTWVCRLSAGCAPGYAVPLRPAEGLTAATALSGGRIAWLTRSLDQASGVRVSLSIRDAAGAELDRMVLVRPLSVDNFEGLAAAPSADGRYRFYLLSDDNFAARQRTLLLAFDWTPPPQRETPK